MVPCGSALLRSTPQCIIQVKLFAPHESLAWNPLIARTFYRRGIIEE